MVAVLWREESRVREADERSSVSIRDDLCRDFASRAGPAAVVELDEPVRVDRDALRRANDGVRARFVVGARAEDRENRRSREQERGLRVPVLEREIQGLCRRRIGPNPSVRQATGVELENGVTEEREIKGLCRRRI